MPDFVADHHVFHNPVEFALSKIGGAYKMPILWRLKDKKWRYSEFKKSINHLSDRMLSKSLKELEEDGFILKEVYAEVPLKVEYSLTPRGQRAIKIIGSIRNYGLELMDEFDVNRPKKSKPNNQSS